MSPASDVDGCRRRWTFEAVNLTGPNSDHAGLANPPYHFRFNAKSGSTYERCLDDLLRVVTDVGEPWCEKFRSPESLLQDPESPLQETAKQHLSDALAGLAEPENEASSLKLLAFADTNRLIDHFTRGGKRSAS